MSQRDVQYWQHDVRERATFSEEGAQGETPLVNRQHEDSIGGSKGGERGNLRMIVAQATAAEIFSRRPQAISLATEPACLFEIGTHERLIAEKLSGSRRVPVGGNEITRLPKPDDYDVGIFRPSAARHVSCRRDLAQGTANTVADSSILDEGHVR